MCLTHFSYEVVSQHLLDPQEIMTYQLRLEFDEEAISGLLNMILTRLISQKLINIMSIYSPPGYMGGVMLHQDTGSLLAVTE